jgi:hypothetical protein
MVVALEARSMQYVRIYAGPDGESHFEEVEVAADLVRVVEGRRVLESGAPMATGAATMMRIGPDWDGSWHPTPRRWFLITLSGEMEITTSDGETRCFGPGALWLLDDTTGKGHNTRVIGGVEWLGLGVTLADQEEHIGRTT